LSARCVCDSGWDFCDFRQEFGDCGQDFRVFMYDFCDWEQIVVMPGRIFGMFGKGLVIICSFFCDLGKDLVESGQDL